MTIFPVLQTFEKDQTKINFTINQLSKGLTGLSAVPINALDFDVDPSGANSSSTGIQTAINQAGVAGGDIVFPPGTYVLTSTPGIGNGTSSLESTTKPVRLRGLGLPGNTKGLGFVNASSVVKFLWGGAAGGNMLQVNGPLQSWAIENIELDAADSALICLLLASASFGDCANLTFSRPKSSGFGLYSTAYGTFVPIGMANSMHNLFRNTVVNLTGANSVGMLFTGAVGVGGGASANTCYDTFISTTVNYTGSAVTSGRGIIAQACDSITLIDTHFYSGGAGSANVVFDYSVTPQWPSNVQFYGVDPSGGIGSVGFINNGTPSGAFANRVFGLIDGNGATVPRIANLYNVDTTRSTAFAFTSTGATQGTAAPLVSDMTVASTVAAGTGAILTALQGTEQRVYNAGANNLKIYPPVGALIDGLGTNNPFTLVPGKQQIFTCWAPTVYESQTAGNMG